MNIIISAAGLAYLRHSGHFRKDGTTPYFTHLARVAGLIAAWPETDENLVAAAYLHDIIEDFKSTEEEVLKYINKDVLALVLEVTNPSIHHKELNRTARKQMDCEHLARASHRGQILKLADRLDNLRSMKNQDKGWIFKYCKETDMLLDHLQFSSWFTPLVKAECHILRKMLDPPMMTK